jgi:hypothetical protein
MYNTIIIALVMPSKFFCYISNKGLIEEWDKEENLAVTGAIATPCLNRRL